MTFGTRFLSRLRFRLGKIIHRRWTDVRPVTLRPDLASRILSAAVERRARGPVSFARDCERLEQLLR